MPNIINSNEVAILKLEGRDLCMLISQSTVGSRMMSGGVLWMKPGAVVRPCHSHPNAEEVLYIAKGQGRVWIDGTVSDVKAEDSVFFPIGSKHMVKNTGKDVLQVFFLYSPPTDPSQYHYHPEIQFPDD